MSVLAVALGKELVAYCVETEVTSQTGCDHVALLFPDAAAGHAGVRGFYHDGDAFWFKRAFHGVCDLLCQALLDLQASGVTLYQPRHFRKADQFVFRDVSDVGDAVKG